MKMSSKPPSRALIAGLGLAAIAFASSIAQADANRCAGLELKIRTRSSITCWKSWPAKTSLKLTGSDFTIYEDRDLATSHFRTYLQVAGGVPIKGMLVRVWTDLKSRRRFKSKHSSKMRPNLSG